MSGMERVAEWLRVSSSGQDEVNQEPDNSRLIADNGWTRTGVVYRLRASASKGKHQEWLDKALADARAGKFDVLVAWLPDRLERRGAFVSAWWIQEMLNAGVRVVFSEPTRGPRYDTSTPRGQEEITRAASYAAEESALRNLRIAAGRAMAKTNGGMLTSAPWGYAVTGPKHRKQFTPTPDGECWIPELFTLAAEMSMRRVKAALKDAGSPLGDKSDVSLWRMVQNRTYTGYIRTKDGNVIGRCTPLVTAKAFADANRGVTSRPRAGGRSATVAMLAKAAKCRVCHQGLYHDSSANGRYDYYRCAGKCTRVPMGRTDALVDQIMSRFTRQITARTLIEPGHDWSAEIADTEMRLRQLASLGLDYEMEDAERLRLRAELLDFKNRPETADVWDDVPTGRTYADEYAALALSERNAWLREHGLTVWAWKLAEEPSLYGYRPLESAWDAGLYVAVTTPGEDTGNRPWASQAA